MGNNEEVFQNDKGELNFNAIVINRDINTVPETLVVKDHDSEKKLTRIKLPGGMMNKCDIDPQSFLKEIERLMREKKGPRFSDDEIAEILEREMELIRLNDISKGTHTAEEYGAVREAIEEVGIWPRKLAHLHFWLKEVNPRYAKADSKPVNYNFFLVTEYSVPQGWAEDFISSDADVTGKLWARDEELMYLPEQGQADDLKIMRIIGTHRPALEALKKKFAGKVSELLSVYE